MNSAKLLFRSTSLLLALLLVIGRPSTVQSWSSSPKKNSNKSQHQQESNAATTTRRKLFQQSAAVVTAAAFPSATKAACLQGDQRPVCIGIYKVPLDDAILPYIGTPEDLKKFAPDLTYVPPTESPKTFDLAMAVLRAQRVAADEIKQHVLRGNLEEAGVAVLGLIPKVTSSARKVFADLETQIRTTGIRSEATTLVVAAQEDSMKENDDGEISTVEALAIDMAEQQMNCVTGYWGDCDITIGQGLRGELGRLTVAQLTILESLRDATCALDDYLVTAQTLSGGTGGGASKMDV